MNLPIKIKAFLSLLIVILMLTACKSVSREDAIKITQDFVNTKVKFFVAEENDTPVVNMASINIGRVEKVDGNWRVYLSISSNQTGHVKSAEMLVIVDGKTGEIINYAQAKKNE